MKKILLIAVLLLFIASNIFAAGKLDSMVTEFKLPNGMKWLLVKRGNTPVFSGIIMARVGGIEEVKGKTGLAHFLEHMAFKGTSEIKSEELWDAFVSNGAADLNAYTSKDATAYHASMPSSKLALWLYLNSEMIKHSSMTDFYKERDVILEEKRSSVENNPKGKLFATLLETAFHDSPYAWPTIGDGDDVAHLEPQDLSEFKKKFYIPSRMVGVLAGDIDLDEAKKLIVQYFADIPSGKDIKETFKTDNQTGPAFASISMKANPSVVIGFHKPTLPSKDDYVFDLITYVLCSGDTSRFNTALVREKRVARGVSCDSSTPGARLDNLFIVLVDPIKGNSPEKIVDAVTEELEKLKTSGISDAELNKAKKNITKDFLFGLSENADLAHSLAYYQTIAGDWRYISRYENNMNKISLDDIKTAAGKYFVDTNRTIITLKKE